MKRGNSEKTAFGALAAVMLFLLLAGPVWAGRRGNLLLIGGGQRTEAMMRKFVTLAGGAGALILVVPTASELPDTGEVYRRELTALGCSRVEVLDVKSTADAAVPERLALVRQAGGIFFAGGDQRRITAALSGTPLLAAIRQALDERGLAVGGTSAGTACMSPVMLTGDGNDGVIRAGAMETRPGLDFFPGVILDQHFVARQRLNRLLTVVADHPKLLGVGVDEATAVWLKPNGEVEVLGEGSVVVVDASKAKLRTGPEKNYGIRGLRVDVLLPGDRFQVKIPGPPRGVATSR